MYVNQLLKQNNTLEKNALYKNFIKDSSKKIRSAVKKTKFYIVQMPFESNDLNLPFRIMNSGIKDKNFWYLIPEKQLSHFKISQLKSLISDEKPLVNTFWQIEGFNAKTIICSYESLRDHLVDIKPEGNIDLPRCIVFDELESYLNTNETVLTELLLRLPDNIAIFLFVSPALEIELFIESLSTNILKRTQIINLMELINTKIPVLYTSNDMIKFIKGKKITPKAKNYLKNDKNCIDITKKHHLNNLIHFLRSNELTPSIFVMNNSQDCDYCFNNVYKGRTYDRSDEVENIITEFEEYAGIQFDKNEIKEILQKKIASVNTDLNFRFNELIELLFYLNYLDILFIPLNCIHLINNSVKTIAMCTSIKESDHTDNKFQLKLDHAYQINRLATYCKNITKKNNNYIMAVNTPDMNITHLKDTILSYSKKIKLPFEVNFPLVLGMLSKSTQEIITHIEHFSDKSSVSDNEIDTQKRVYELAIEIMDELKGSRCKSSLAAIKLIDLRFTLIQKINKYELNIKNDPKDRSMNSYYINAIKDLNSEISLLPCETCLNYHTCHRRNHRKLKNFLDEYYFLNKNKKTNIAFSILKVNDYMSCLRELDLIDENNKLTYLGNISCKINLKFPMLLALCYISKIFHNINDPCTKISLTGSFIDTFNINLQQFSYDDFIYQEIEDVYKRIIDLITPFRKIILQYGIYPDKPEQIISLILMAWQMDIKFSYISKRLNISEGYLSNIYFQANYLYNRIFEKNEL